MRNRRPQRPSNNGQVAGADDLQRHLATEAQRQAAVNQAEVKIENFVFNTAAGVFANLAAAHIATRDEELDTDAQAHADQMRAIAQESKGAALFLAEAFGLITVKTEPAATEG